MTASARGDRLVVEGPEGRGEHEGCVMTFADFCLFVIARDGYEYADVYLQAKVREFPRLGEIE